MTCQAVVTIGAVKLRHLSSNYREWVGQIVITLRVNSDGEEKCPWEENCIYIDSIVKLIHEVIIHPSSGSGCHKFYFPYQRD